jgi:5-methyltetrahydrofolate--homocysteine methyltransferase
LTHDDIEIYGDPARTKVIGRFQTMRQQSKKAPGVPYIALADFIAPAGTPDFLGGFAVTAGHGVDERVKRFEAAHDDYSAILLKALADRLAEAFAEKLHEVVRQELWGYETVRLSNDQLIKEEYQGIRPAPGYPACPDHTEKPELFRLLDATKHTGITLTEGLAMSPAAAVSGFYFAHPQSKYFGIGRVAKDQIADLARRKGEPWNGWNAGWGATWVTKPEPMVHVERGHTDETPLHRDSVPRPRQPRSGAIPYWVDAGERRLYGCDRHR